MPEQDAPEQAEFRRRVRSWLAEVSEPRAPGTADRADTAEQVEAGRQWQRRKQAAGFGGLTWPAGFGGQGRDTIDQIIWDQEAAAFDVPEEAFIVSTMLAGPTIIDVGQPEQQDRFLPPILAGDAVWCQLFSEPSAGWIWPPCAPGPYSTAMPGWSMARRSGVPARITLTGPCCSRAPIRRPASTRGCRCSPWTCTPPVSRSAPSNR